MDDRPGCRIVIFDDEPKKSQRLQAALLGLRVPGMDVRAPSNLEIEAQLDALYARREALDTGKALSGIPSMLDDTDVLIADFDLRDLKDHRGFATGEEIAYSARLFSKVKIVVVVNHPSIGLHNFDLTLQRDREYRGDVYVGSEQCLNPGLWVIDAGHRGFLPWSWIPLIEEVRSFGQCASQIAQNANVGTLQFFGLDKEDTRPSPQMLSYLGIKRDEDVLIKDLLGQPSATYVRQKDLGPLSIDNERYSQVATAMLRKWFRRWVMPPQTLLADLPHLGMALPWGLCDYKDPELWSRLAHCGRSSAGCDVATLVQAPVAQQRFQRIEWSGRPTFFLARARAATEAAGTFLPAFKAAEVPKIAFAEDLSRFVEADQVTEYALTLDGETQLRNVSDAKRVKIEGDTYGLEKIIYSPESLIL